MIEDKLVSYLKAAGFQFLVLNEDDINLSYIIHEGKVHMISIWKRFEWERFTVVQYGYILEQMKRNFITQGFTHVNLLSIICTQSPEKVKEYCSHENSHWIIDTMMNRLIIYENQPSNYLGLKNVISELLEGGNYNSINHKEKKGYSVFTLFNTLLVVINVLVFLVIYFSKYGDDIVSRGALSWHRVVRSKEYYRIVTSMFIHAEFDHLFNNMIVLLFVGDNLERATGKIKYLLVYIGTGAIAALSSIGYNMIQGNNVYSIGASGAVFGVIGAMIYILLIHKGELEDINAKQISLFVIFSLYGGINSVGVDNMAHIGGFISGLVLSFILYRKKNVDIGKNK